MKLYLLQEPVTGEKLPTHVICVSNSWSYGSEACVKTPTSICCGEARKMAEWTLDFPIKIDFLSASDIKMAKMLFSGTFLSENKTAL